MTKATVASLAPGFPQWMLDLNIGIVALGLNVAIAAAVSFADRLVLRAAPAAAE